MRPLLGDKAPSALQDAVAACREHFLLAAGLSALVNILYLAPTIYMMQVYDRVVPTGGTWTLFWITLVVAFALATLALLDSIRSRIMVRSSLRLERLLAGPILDRLLARQRAEPGDPSTAQAMREFDALRGALGGQPAIVLFDIPWTPIYLIVAFLLHPLLALTILVGATLLFGITWLNERRTRPLQAEALTATALAYARQERIAARGDMVRALGMRRAMVTRQLDERASGLVLGSRAQMASGRYVSAAKFLRLFMQSLALGIGAWLAIERQISVGAIIAASVLLSRALQPVEQLVAALPAINQARQAVRTLTTLFARTETHDTERTTLPQPSGKIRLGNVHVRAGVQGPLLLRDVSFEAEPGQIVGVIGPSGAGKTTLARVLAGALPPDAGTVRVDGANVLDWNPELLARHIGYVPQDMAMLPGTIAENISRFALAAGEDRATVDARVIEAARKAGVHDLILALPGGYDRMLDIDGNGLSAGQRQRVALARALYGDPAILILDEPNSALDSEGEAALARALAEARKRGATVIMVAHRSGILSLADRLLVLNGGAVERHGARDDVIAALSAKASASNVVGIKGA